MPLSPADLSVPVRLDRLNACLWRGAQRIALRPKTFAVLQCLLAHPGQLVTKATLLDTVWPETTVNDVALMICIRELRQALGDDPKAPRFIETLHRRGYRFVGDLPLTLLTKDAMATYLVRRLPGLQEIERLAGLLQQRTEGNPLFMVMLIESWLTQGLLLEQDGAWVLPEGVAALHARVPDSLRQMIDIQLDGLSAEEQRVFEAASVAGTEFSAAAVAAGLAQEVERVDDGCTSLARRGQFLGACGEQTWPDGTVAGGYRFVHALYQQALYNRVSAAQRVRLHQRLGARLEAGHGAQADAIAAELAMHFERGRDDQRALYYLLQAGKHSNAQSAYVEAVTHLTRGLEVLQKLPDTPARAQHELDIQVALAGALRVTKGWAALEVGHAYARARALCQQVGNTPQHYNALWGVIGFYQNRGELRTAYELAEQFLSLSQCQRDPAGLLRAHNLMGVILFFLGELVPAHTHLEQALALTASQADRTLTLRAGQDSRVLSLGYMARVLWVLGYPDKALVKSHEMLTHAQALSHDFSLARALFYVAVLHRFRREGCAAREQVEAALALVTEQGFGHYLGSATFIRGYAMPIQGQSAAGIAQMHQGLAAVQATEQAVSLSTHLTLLAEAYGNSIQAEEGLRLLAEALAHVDHTGERFYEAEVYRVKGELLLQAVPDAPQAEACFQQAIAVARRQQAKSWELRAAVSLSRLWQHQGKRAEARALLAPIYSWFTEGFDTADLQEAGALLDELA